MVQMDKMPEWMDTVKKAEWTSKDKNKVGSTIHIVGEAAGAKMEYDAEITEFIENEKGAWRTISGNVTSFGGITLSPTKAGTKVDLAFNYELPYSVLGKLIDKLRVHKALEKDFDIAAKKLKDTVEK